MSKMKDFFHDRINADNLEAHDWAELGKQEQMHEWLCFFMGLLVVLGYLAMCFDYVVLGGCLALAGVFVAALVMVRANMLAKEVAVWKKHYCKQMLKEGDLRASYNTESARKTHREVDLVSKLKKQGIYAEYHGPAGGWFLKCGIAQES
jgi:hypothetical protein